MQPHFFCILRQDTTHLVSGLVDATCLIPFLLEKNQQGEEDEEEEGRKEACALVLCCLSWENHCSGSARAPTSPSTSASSGATHPCLKLHH